MIQRGEIYFVDLNPTRGREQSGKRPVLVLSNDTINKLPLVVTVVVGTKGENIPRDYPTNVRVSASESGLPMDTVFLCFQIRSIDPGRFPQEAAGKLPDGLWKKSKMRFVIASICKLINNYPIFHYLPAGRRLRVLCALCG